VIDTHAHLDSLGGPASEALARARNAGVRTVIAIGSGLSSCKAVLEIADREVGVFAALGIHPHQAAEARPSDLDRLRELLAHPKAVAVGETGLDYYRDRAPRDRQADLFRAQAALAAELGKALVVHSRLAEVDTAAILADVRADVPVILHCFSAGELLEPALERGWYISFAGNVTYPKAAELRWAATQVPRNRLLVETDSPYLAPQPVRGRPNEPAYVGHIVSALAELRREDIASLELAIETNANAAFGLPPFNRTGDER
jgi:TatD DNase family protein